MKIILSQRIDFEPEYEDIPFRKDTAIRFVPEINLFTIRATGLKKNSGIILAAV